MCAFSWPNGRIFLSRGLVDGLDDTTLSAAIAHEIGHLLNHHHGRASPVAALRSEDGEFEAEVRADRAGMELLFACGLPRDAMAGVLSELLRRENLSGHAARKLRRRVELLTTQSRRDGTPSAPRAEPPGGELLHTRSGNR